MSQLRVARQMHGAPAIHARVVRLNESFLDLPVLDEEGVTFAPRSAEDGGTIKCQVQGFCEFGTRIGKEANLLKCLVL